MNVSLITSIIILSLVFSAPADAKRKRVLSVPQNVVVEEDITQEEISKEKNDNDELLVEEPKNPDLLVEPDISIEISEAEETKSGGIGVLSPNRVGLDDDLWQDISEKDLLSLLSEMPKYLESKSLSNLLIRVLLVETGRSDLSDAVMIARVESLLGMGQAKLAVDLLDSVPDNFSTVKIDKYKHILNILHGTSINKSCEYVDEQQNKSHDEFWQRYQVLCLFKNGDDAKANLGLSLLQEQNNLPRFFEEIAAAVNSESEIESEIDISSLTMEELAWLALAQKFPKEISDNLSLRQLALISLNDDNKRKMSDKLKGLDINIRSVDIPNDSSPNIPLSLLRLNDNAETKDIRLAFFALSMRNAWDKPISIEAEMALRNKSYSAELNELPLTWRINEESLQEGGQRLASIVSLLKPVKHPLNSYTVSDLLFLVQELKSLGLPNDATAVVEEVLAY